jgi:hypothetical protein
MVLDHFLSLDYEHTSACPFGEWDRFRRTTRSTRASIRFIQNSAKYPVRAGEPAVSQGHITGDQGSEANLGGGPREALGETMY